MRIRILRGFWASRFGLALLGIALLILLTGIGTFTYYWLRYSRMIDERLSGRPLQTTARIYSAPGHIYTSEAMSPQELASYLQRAGYTDTDVPGATGRYVTSAGAVIIRPSSESYFAGKNALRVDFSGKQIARISALDSGAALDSAEIEPELLTNLFDSAREKRRPVRYEDLPKALVDAVLSAEDKRFFEHPGFDPVRVLGAAWADIRKERLAEGASTLTMQVARSFFFTRVQTWSRKAAETMVALQLERRFTKQQIFELYANEIYLGNRGSFAIHGFGEAAPAYFGKDVRELNVGEAAFLAGIIRAPNRYSTAERRPERAVEARDRVLTQMVENKVLSPEAAQAARKAPLRMVSGAIETSAAPYFVDIVKDDLLDKFTEADLLGQSFRVYSTLDPALERAAVLAVEAGMENVDKQLAPRYARWKKEAAQAAARAAKLGKPAPPANVPEAQVALVAMDPHTGEIKALIGGRNYGQSQLNRALARRQPGSVFKPFVYAAAFDDAATGVGPIVTPATTVVDEPTTFEFEGQEYTPNNYGEQFHGTVTLRDALIHSLNVATVKVAEMVGYGRVVEVARQIGLDPKIQPTPAVALGAYEMTPVEVAAGYTVFANGGVRVEPIPLRAVRSANGDVLERMDPKTRQALDPRVAYLVTNLLQDVINRGTAAGVRARGFTAPAAGKTGTSHDAWFAGYTSNLLCVIWVGFDDNRDFGLSGASSAAPIWAEFMKRAVTLPGYRDTREFAAPDGVVGVMIDPDTQQLATTTCPVTRHEVFLLGTEPTELCSRHPGSALAMSDAGTAPASAESSAGVGAGAVSAAGGAPPPEGGVTTPRTDSRQAAKGVEKALAKKPTAPAAQPDEPEKKKGLMDRIFGIFGKGKKQQEKKPPS